MPATMPPLMPPLVPPAAEAAEARDGREPAEVTPLHRSAETLRAEAGAGAVLLAGARVALLELAVDVLRVVARLGAVELAKTVWPPARATPAVEPLVRALSAPRLRATGVVRAGAVAGACARAVERAA